MDHAGRVGHRTSLPGRPDVIGAAETAGVPRRATCAFFAQMHTRLLSLVAVLVALARASVSGQEPVQGSADSGRLIERRVVTEDTTKSYAAYLPPGHHPGRRWPALVLMDPRGRALVPLERFRPAAAALGYVLLSSYDTSSDEATSGEDTREAVEAVLNDALDLFSLDLRRLVPVGFSGTARMAWLLALGAPEVFGAIIGFGGGIAPHVGLLLAAGEAGAPAFFGGAGTGDFNYGEMWRTDAALERAGSSPALVFFPGRHEWPPADLASAAVEWLEVGAQGRGLALADTAWIRALAERDLDAAEALERGGRAHDAMLRYRRLLATFEPAAGIAGEALMASARAAARRLAESREVRKTTASLEEWLRWEAGRHRALEAVASRLEDPRIPSVRDLARTLDLDAVRRQAASPDTLAAQAARRILAGYLARARFYLPRHHLARGDAPRAIRSMELAHAIAPDSRAVCAAFLVLPETQRSRSPDLTALCGEPDPPAPVR